MSPTNLKSWDFVKNLKHDTKTLRSGDRPEDFYYQFDGHYYTPACRVRDFEMIPEKKW